MEEMNPQQVFDIPCGPGGLQCINDENDPPCLDYEVRYMCAPEDSEMLIPSEGDYFTGGFLVDSDLSEL